MSNNEYVINEEAIREIIEGVGRCAATYCAASFLTEVVLKGFISPRSTKIVVEDGIPAELYTIGEKDKPKVVYVSSKKSRVNLVPVAFYGGIYAACRLYLKYREKNYASVK